MENEGLTVSKSFVLAGLRNLYSGKTVLDLGCFDGRWSKFCLDRGAKRAIGVDNLAYTKEHGIDPYYGRSEPVNLIDKRIEFINGDAERVELPNVDFTVAYDILFCFDNSLEFLKRLRAKTKTIVCTFIVPAPHEYEENPGYVAVKHKHTIDSARKLLEQAGFKAELVYGILDRAFYLGE